MFRPKKRFGQNFLRDRVALQRIVELLQIKDQLLVEIGPGKGALTELLFERTKKLVAIELDRDLVPDLKRRFLGLTIYQQDALKFDYHCLTAPLIVVGNLPYNISTPLLFKFIEMVEKIERLGVMLQKEVADRLKALPGTKNFGKLSIMFQLDFEVKESFNLPADAFYPVPKVESTFLVAEPRVLPYQIKDKQLFSSIVSKAFNVRRKMLKNSLVGYQTILGKYGDKRPEELNIQEWINLSNKICDLLMK